MESISEPEITLNALSRDLAHVIEQVNSMAVRSQLTPGVICCFERRLLA